MKKGQAVSAINNHSDSTIVDLVEAAFTQIRQLGVAEESSRLFPNGVRSLDLEIGSGAEVKPDVRISLRISAAQAEATDDETSPFLVTMNGDVEVTFNTEGHHIVALITEQDLKQRFPNTMSKVQKILDDGGRSLLDAATFPDDIRETQPKTKPFHFIDIPFRNGGPVNPPFPDPPHVISKIADFTSALEHGRGSAEDRVNALSWLIHIFGDIHQPLHCIEHFSELHPAGDRGGNSFLLKGNAKNLHSLWDSSVSFTHSENQELALDIMKEHSRDELATDLHTTNVESWARTSFQLAKKFAYGPLHENPAAPPTPKKIYLKNAEKVGRQQAALAGYRLSDRLREILG